MTIKQIILMISGLLPLMSCSFFSKPLYEPGRIKSSDIGLDPQSQSANSSQLWHVEEDISLFHFSQGTGENILILHGGPGIPNKSPWKGLTPLTDSLKMHYYNQRGCGQSTLPFDRFESKNFYKNLTVLEEKLGLSAHIADVERIRRILGNEKITLVGHSFGGFIAALYAAEFPERVRSLILVNPASVLELPTPFNLFDIVKQKLPAKDLQDYDHWINNYFDYKNIFSKSEAELRQLNEEFGKFWSLVYPESGLTMPEEIADKTGGWVVHAINFSMGQKHDYREAMGKITCPTLILHGEKDLIPLQASVVYQNLIKGSILKIIEDAGHFPFEENPDAFTHTFWEFLSGVIN